MKKERKKKEEKERGEELFANDTKTSEKLKNRTSMTPC